MECEKLMVKNNKTWEVNDIFSNNEKNQMAVAKEAEVRLEKGQK